MVEVLVDYVYTAEQDDELSINVGDIVKNVVRSEGGWWEGELNGKRGLFPDNFVKVINDPDKKDETKKEDVSKKSQKGSSVRELANKLKDGVPIVAAPQKKKEPKKYAKAEFAYEPEAEDELKIEVGDVIEILKQEEEGWLEGSVHGRVGIFPSNFVKIIEESEMENGEDKDKGDNLPKVKKVKGFGLGNIFEGGPIKLRSTGPGSSIKKTTGQPATQDGKPDTPELPVVTTREKKKNVDKAIVRFSYAAENDDELSLKEGDLINILDKELEDAGWWKGEVGGKVGVFPDNFVEAIEVLEEGKIKKAVPAAKQPPKLPDKGPAGDSGKASEHTDKHVRNKEEPTPSEKNPPNLPGKRPLPPPIKRKPTKSDPPKIQGDKNTSTTITPSTKEEQRAATPPLKDDKKNDAGFDSVETNEKLTHLTQARPKGPSKRPPSQVMLHNNKQLQIKEEVQNGDIKESLKEDTTGQRNLVSTAKAKKDEPHIDRRSMYGLEPVREKGSLHHHGPARPPDPTPGGSLHSSLEDLRREMRELKLNTISKAAYDELKLENERIKQEVESMKTSYSKRFRELFEELDEEKKIRLSTQVEMERIRKIMSESHV